MNTSVPSGLGIIHIMYIPIGYNSTKYIILVQLTSQPNIDFL